MSIRLNDGSYFRVINDKNQDITTKSKFDPEKTKIQIDTDGNGLFTDSHDITISDQAQIKSLTDNIKGNISNVDQIKFAGEIESHLSHNEGINALLRESRDAGKMAKEANIFKKAKYGKVAVEKVRTAFHKDKANPEARSAFGLSIIRIFQHPKRNMAEKTMDIDLNKLSKEIIPHLKNDSQDLLGQIILQNIYHELGDTNNENVVKNSLKQASENNPPEVFAAKQAYKMLLNR